MISAQELGTPRPGGEQWGPPIWQRLDETINEIPCPTCRYGGASGITALHDMVNLKVQRPVYDPENLHRFRSYIDAADDAARGKRGARDRLLQTMARDMNRMGVAPSGSCPSCALQPAAATEESGSSLLPWIVIGGFALIAGMAFLVGGQQR